MREATDFMNHSAGEYHLGSPRSLVRWINHLGFFLLVLTGLGQVGAALLSDYMADQVRLLFAVQGVATLIFGPMILYVLCALALAVFDLRDDTRAQRRKAEADQVDDS